MTDMNRIRFVLIAAATLTYSLSGMGSAGATTTNTTSTKVTTIQETIKEASIAAKKAKESVDTLKKTEDTLTKTTQTATKAKQDAIKVLNSAEQTFQKTDADFIAAKAAYDAANKTLTDTKTVYDAANKTLTDTKTVYDAANKTLIDAKAALAAAKTQAQKSAAQQTVTNATTVFNTANTKLNDAKTQFSTATTKLNDATNKCNTATGKLNDATSKRTTAEQARNQASQQAQTVTANADKSVKDAEDARNQAKLEADNAAKYSVEAQEAAKKASDWSTMKRPTVKDRSEDKNFLSILPQFQALVQKEGVAIPADQVKAQKVDFSHLFLAQKHNVRVWFLNEGAAYKNQLAYESIRGDKYGNGMIFENVSCNSTKNKCEKGEKDGVLDIGDFVDLGSFKSGTQLNFLLKADGYSAKPQNGDIYGADPTLNPDGLQHLMGWKIGNYLMMGFEDLRNGGDKDYNDTMFVVDFGKDNLKASAVPEPSATLPILGLGALGMLKLRRRRR
ncbi:DUF4114 domain-containing protein [Nostoc cycadae]|uniref:DUF4114 domain-containing protein n=1 Tax=Nostoc cycadae WK-1 TaxID=1861711 RepID=A0A2H6LBF4_9NOSO|nr:DUF4114 domain-containing protein [Nostoc cycadae]GBE90584.1 hypothetical protein NCWK1_0301 [Nostoc cycadae WK-1]